jgi:PAS domain S-box-containing protein
MTCGAALLGLAALANLPAALDWSGFADLALGTLLLGASLAIDAASAGRRRLLVRATALIALACGLAHCFGPVSLHLADLARTGPPAFLGWSKRGLAIAGAVILLALAQFAIRPPRRGGHWVRTALGLAAVGLSLYALFVSFSDAAFNLPERVPAPGPLLQALALLVISAGTLALRPEGTFASLAVRGGPVARLLRRNLLLALVVPPMITTVAGLLHRTSAATPPATFGLVATLAAMAALLVVIANEHTKQRIEDHRRSTEQAIADTREVIAFGRHVADVLGSSGLVPDMLRRATDAIAAHLDIVCVRVWVRESGSDRMVLSAYAGSEFPAGNSRPIALPNHNPDPRTPVLNNRLQIDLEPAQRGWARSQGLTSFVGYPLRTGDTSEGLLEIFARRRLPEDFLQALVPLAGDLAVVLRRGRTEAALRDSESRARAVIDTMLEALIELDQDGRIQSANPAAERMFAIPRNQFPDHTLAELIEMPPSSGLEPAGAGETAPPLQAAMLSRRVEATGVRRDRSRFPLELSITRVAFDNHSGFTALVHDLTTRRSLEEQLRHSQKMEAIGRLAGGVAHDFNNLLTVIRGCTQFALLRSGTPPRVADDLREIDEAAERAGQLTAQLLAFSRRQVMQPRVVDLNVRLDAIDGMLRRLIGENVHLAMRHGKDLGAVRVDPGQLDQVILNLVVNALDALPDGGRIVVQTANVDLDDHFCGSHPGTRPGPHVLLAVSDTGCGMDSKTLTRIFEPFFTTKEPGKGTGLGLSTVYGIVQQSDGTIWAHSEPGRGTTFRIYFPREHGQAAPLPAGRSSSAPLCGTETVLVAEDDPVVREVASEMLRLQGYRVLTAGCGREALEILTDRAEDADLVLTDLVMPGLSGRELSTRLRALPRVPRVVFTSGYSADHLERFELAPDDHFVQKPFTMESLVSKVREVLDLPGHGANGASGANEGTPA